ncbi:MAG TPA: sigma factor-like helix-turn-helix DNA-binding protein, partial [Gemmatimonadales bacterium]|nr:sigma factor-like helix-turn-helix DNA-binding protein [Gemmatimonadales bacterium]
GFYSLDASTNLNITEALSQLPPREQEVIRLRYFEHLGDSEIALRLSAPLGTVKGRIRSGLLHLREQFEITPPVKRQSWPEPVCTPKRAAFQVSVMDS